MFENKRQALAPKSVYYKRMMKNLAWGVFIIFLCLIIGVAGYHYTANIEWLDSLHNASMILSGMGRRLKLNRMAENGFLLFMPCSAELFLLQILDSFLRRLYTGFFTNFILRRKIVRIDFSIFSF